MFCFWSVIGVGVVSYVLAYHISDKIRPDQTCFWEFFDPQYFLCPSYLPLTQS